MTPCPATSTTSRKSAGACPARDAASARDAGWCDAWAKLKATDAASGSSAGRTATPSVSVPVLSKTTVSMSANRSSAVGDFSSTPARNKRPVIAAVTAGMASAKAQGQVMINVAVATAMA